MGRGKSKATKKGRRGSPGKVETETGAASVDVETNDGPRKSQNQNGGESGGRVTGHLVRTETEATSFGAGTHVLEGTQQEKKKKKVGGDVGSPVHQAV